ncbi:glycosyltransferase family 2 protein [Breznakiellaceae bacterium SP9]
MSSKILVFIPMYNCEKQIARVLSKIAALNEKQQYLSEILVVDNDSKDKGLEAASKAAEQLAVKTTVVKNKENIYLGGSHKVAFNYAIDNNFDYVIVLHGDDQGDINDIIPYIENGEYKKYDSFLGSRFHKESKLVNYSKLRILGNVVFNALISIAAAHKLSDMGAGLNMYDVNYLKNRFYLYFPNNLTFNVYLLFYGLFIKSKFAFFPLTWREEDQKSNAKLFSQSLEIAGLMFRYMFGKKRLFSTWANAYSDMVYEYDVVFTKEAERE